MKELELNSIRGERIKGPGAKDQKATTEGSENDTQTIDVQKRLVSLELQQIPLGRISCIPGYRHSDNRLAASF